MARNRVYIPVSSAEYAELYGVSQRTAQRRIANTPGAFRSKRRGRWNLPLTSKQYAEAKGVSQSTARKHGVKVPTLLDFQEVINKREIPKSEQAAASNFIALLAAEGKNVNAEQVYEGMRRANRSQLRHIEKMHSLPSEWYDDEWLDADGESVLYYH
jgi:hypothetical protein